MGRLLVILSMVLLMLTANALAQPLTVDPESIVPLPDKFDMEVPSADVSPDIARFQGAWIGTWHDDRHILVVERVKANGQANVVFAQSDSAFYGMNREWWRDEATIVDGALTMKGFRFFHYVFDGPDRLYMTATFKNGAVTSGMLVRTDPARLAAGERPASWPWPGEHASIPHLTVRTPDGTRPIMLEATFYPVKDPHPGAARDLYPRIGCRPQPAEKLVLLDRGALAARQWIRRVGADATRSRPIRRRQR